VVLQERNEGTPLPSLRLDSLLTSVDAVQSALSYNPRVQIALGEIGVTRADLIEALTLDNPRLFGSARWPGSGSGYLIDLELSQNFQKLILMASSRKLADLQSEEARLRAVGEILSVASEAEIAFLDAVAARHTAILNRMIAESSAASAEFALRQKEAGNLSELEFLREQAMFEDARMELAESELIANEALNELLRVMSVPSEEYDLITIPDQLPAIDEEAADLPVLERAAIEGSPEIALRIQSIEVVAQALGISRDWRWLGSVEFGVAGEREREGTWLTGPSLSIEVPIFDRNQPEIQRQEAWLHQREQELVQSAIDLRASVRTQHERLLFSQQKARHMLEIVIPAKESILKQTQRQYNYMLTGVYEVLQARNEEYESYREYIDALHRYWVSHAELRRLIGGKLPGAMTETEMESASEVAPAPHNANAPERTLE